MRKEKTVFVIAAFIFSSSPALWAQTYQTDPSSASASQKTANRATQSQELKPILPSPRVQRRKGPIVIQELRHDTGPVLRDVEPLLPEFSNPSPHEIENNVNPNHRWRNLPQKDLVLQTPELSPLLQTPNYGVEFDGIGYGDNVFCYCMPPDNDGAVGPTQYVQFNNVAYQVFDKSGNTLLGPLSGNTFWSGFGGSCQSDNSGDPTIRFDAAAQRWVVAQFAINSSAPDYECVAVSTTADATGSYTRYAFPFTDFPDYPKLGVWPDGYYFTFNDFNIAGTAFMGANVCAADRNKMLAGSAATMQCFQQNSGQFGMLPSDEDGPIPPATGTPNFVVELDPSGNPNLDLFKFHVDFTTPANSTFTGPTLIPITAFTPLCNTSYRGGCVPQPTSGSDLLESLSDRLMWRLVYRNFGDHTTLLVTHSIVAGSSGGVRWYEIHNPETSPTVFQSGTFAPDSQYRWMPAIAMDGSQDIAVGYSVSGSGAGQYPSLAYAGRESTDPAGTLESEVVMKAGAGSQQSGYGRWGDYSSLTVDPTDDCTFWFSEEYEKATGGFNWSTAIGSFKFPGCAGTANFSLSASPSSLTVGQGSSGASTVTLTPSNGFTGSAILSASSLPKGVTASFSPTSISSTASSTVTLPVTTSATAGNYSVTITGTGGGITQATPLALTVAVPTFTLASSAPSASVLMGSPASITLTRSASNGFAAVVTLSASGLPKGVTATFSPTSIAGSGSGTSTLTLTEGAGAAAGTSTVTVTATGQSVTKTVTIALTVVPPGLAMSLSAPGATVVVGSPVNFIVTGAATNGFNSPVTLATTGLPKGVTASFSPSAIAAPGSGSSTLTLTETTGAVAGTYSVAVTGTGSGITNSVTLSLTVVVPSFTMTPSGATATVALGAPAAVTITTAVLNGFSSAIALSVSGVPKAITAAFSPTAIAAPGNGSSTLTFTLASGAISGAYAITITATGLGLTHTALLSLTVVAPSFIITPSSLAVLVGQGHSNQVTLTETAQNGFNSSVALSSSGAPSGVTVSFSPTALTANTPVTATMIASAGATPGSYTITITGTGGALTQTASLALIVAVPTYTLTPNLSVARGSSVTFVLTTTTLNQFSSAIALSVSGVPSGVTASFSPTSIASPGNGNSTLTVAPASGATPGTYILTVTSAGAAVTQTQNLTLVVTP
jgi:uncharacterized membrane protein